MVDFQWKKKTKFTMKLMILDDFGWCLMLLDAFGWFWMPLEWPWECVKCFRNSIKPGGLTMENGELPKLIWSTWAHGSENGSFTINLHLMGISMVVSCHICFNMFQHGGWASHVWWWHMTFCYFVQPLDGMGCPIFRSQMSNVPKPLWNSSR